MFGLNLPGELAGLARSFLNDAFAVARDLLSEEQSSGPVYGPRQYGYCDISEGAPTFAVEYPTCSLEDKPDMALAIIPTDETTQTINLEELIQDGKQSIGEASTSASAVVLYSAPESEDLMTQLYNASLEYASENPYVAGGAAVIGTGAVLVGGYYTLKKSGVKVEDITLENAAKALPLVQAVLEVSPTAKAVLDGVKDQATLALLGSLKPKHQALVAGLGKEALSRVVSEPKYLQRLISKPSELLADAPEVLAAIRKSPAMAFVKGVAHKSALDIIKKYSPEVAAAFALVPPSTLAKVAELPIEQLKGFLYGFAKNNDQIIPMQEGSKIKVAKSTI